MVPQGISMQNPSAGGVGATGGAGDICGAGNTGGTRDNCWANWGFLVMQGLVFKVISVGMSSSS